MKKILLYLLFISMLFGEQRFIRDNNKQIVKDTRTYLMWQDNDLKYLSWYDGMKYCKNLTLGGYNDWRLPNRRELFTIFIWGRKNNISPVFYHVKDVYWSSTSLLWYPAYAWYVSFEGGYDGSNLKTLKAYIRCVRDY